MTPTPTMDALGKAADALAIAESRASAKRSERDRLIRLALDDGHAVSAVSRQCKISRTAVRKIAATVVEDDQ